MRPLEGITVVALEQVIAGPFATRQLAELGARVIKIERPRGGDSARALRPHGEGPVVAFRVGQPLEGEPCARREASRRRKTILEKLLAKADVFLHNLAPGRGGAPGPRFAAS